MELPEALKQAILEETHGAELRTLIEDAEKLSFRYRSEPRGGKRLLTSCPEAAAYAAARMPATFGAVADALMHIVRVTDISIGSLTDAGAGTGAASWAAAYAFSLERVLCLEREDSMRRLGKRMMASGPEVLRKAEWLPFDIAADDIPARADLVIASYVLNEMGPRDRLNSAEKLWNSAEKLLLIVEPGTPAACSGLAEIRAFLLSKGACIAAPCPHGSECGLGKDDWCHFSCRVSRSRLHRELKGGDAPFEDEKYSYLAFAREENKVSFGRVIRHPVIKKGHIEMRICAPDSIRDVTVSKSGGESYRLARKAKWGDELPVGPLDGRSSDP
jgi:ribosomal protein RSM22 (predicted rRNA methylase)